MKKSFGIIGAVLISVSLCGQKSIDDLFAKYGGMDGFTTVTINGNILKLAATAADNKDNPMPENISMIRILSQDEENKDANINFFDMVIKDIDLSKYEEFMQVKEKNESLRMLVRMEGNRFTEFLLISGGESNAIIQIKGSMTLEEARKFADDAKKDKGSPADIGKDW